MDSLQYEALTKLFHSKQLVPWVPEHKLFIEAKIKELELLDPGDAEAYREFYGNFLASHLAETAPAESEVSPEEIPAVLEESKPEEEAKEPEVKVPKKRGRKPKNP